ncbi:MAG: Gmad2 immunoglobulin-like domain-containing protein [Symbiobacterium sp.]|uniref:Gmad2 immunoglobulin-like domain-containing protein n=1 Tax=Symbiobacterium sp. TaxID=1971213 RepID=UPI0034649B29
MCRSVKQWTTALLLAVLTAGCAAWAPPQEPAPESVEETAPVSAQEPAQENQGGARPDQTSDCTAPPLNIAGGVTGLTPVMANQPLPEAVCAWVAAIQEHGGLVTLFEEGKTYLVAAPGTAGALTITRLARREGAVEVGYRITEGQKGAPGVAVLAADAAGGEPPRVVQGPEPGSPWLPAVRNPHSLPPVPLPEAGVRLASALHDQACTGRVVVSGFAMVNENVLLVRVRDGGGALLGEVQAEAGGGRGDWGSFVVTVPLAGQPSGDTGTAEVLSIRGEDWALSDRLALRFTPPAQVGGAVEPDPGRVWEPEAAELTVAGAPLRSRLEELETLLGPGSSFDDRTYVFGNGAVWAHFPYAAHLQAQAHRLVTASGEAGAGVAVGQCAAEVVARLGAPQAIAADGAEWRYLSPSSHAALTVRFGPRGLVTEIELASYYPAPDASAPPPPPLDEATARELLTRFWNADLYERAELLTTGRAAAHYREWVAGAPVNLKAEDWFPDAIRLSVEPDGEGTLVRMDYVSNFTGQASTLTWRFVPVGGTWRIAGWQVAGQWLP